MFNCFGHPGLKYILLRTYVTAVRCVSLPLRTCSPFPDSRIHINPAARSVMKLNCADDVLGRQSLMNHHWMSRWIDVDSKGSKKVRSAPKLSMAVT